jgi:DNA-binding GntR family transcriptional regulator
MLNFASPGSSSGEQAGVSADDMASAVDGARSLTMAVYQQLRKDIITNQLAQNEKLQLAPLQERFNVSLSVLREALSRLVADGLVVAKAQRGFSVSPISKSDLIDVTRTRVRIEGLALQIAIENGDSAWLDAVSASHDAMVATDRVLQTRLWAQRHAEFHRLLLAPCDSPWTMRFRDILFEQSERYRFLLAKFAITNQLSIERDVAGEHRALLDAACARNAEAAVAALQTHFMRTMEGVLALTAID